MLYPFFRLCRPARSPASCGPAAHKKRGFNLIESAIVLGVVGLVIGGIWVAAATINENYKVNKTVADLQLIVKNIQNMISISDAMTIGNAGITQLLLNAGVFPADWGNKTPFGSTISVYQSITFGVNFTIRLSDVPRSSCIKIITRISAIAAAKGSVTSTLLTGTGDSLGRIRVNMTAPESWVTDTFPISPSVAGTACALSVNRLDLYYNYTRIN